MRQTGYLPRPPTSTLPPEILHAGVGVQEEVTYCKFCQNWSRGLGAVGIKNRPLPLTRPMAYTTDCTTVQDVMWEVVSLLLCMCVPLKWVICVG